MGIFSVASPYKNTHSSGKVKWQGAEKPDQQTEGPPAVDDGAEGESINPCILTHDTPTSGQSLGHIASPL